MQVREQIGRSRQPLALTNGGDAGVEPQLGEDFLTGKQSDIKVRSLGAVPCRGSCHIAYRMCIMITGDV